MFNKDLLVIDIESTGTDVTKHEIIQIAGILLDKNTLAEKTRYESFVKPVNWDVQDPEAMAVAQVSWEDVKDAPDLLEVLTQFVKTFGTDLIPVTYGGNLDIIFLPAAFRKVGQIYPYDYHTFNFWPLCYVYMAKLNKLTAPEKFAGFSFEQVAQHLDVPIPPNRHTAIGDCELEADVLRDLLPKFKI